jgi:hypothetical protein
VRQKRFLDGSGQFVIQAVIGILATSCHIERMTVYSPKRSREAHQLASAHNTGLKSGKAAAIIPGHEKGLPRQTPDPCPQGAASPAFPSP